VLPVSVALGEELADLVRPVRDSEELLQAASEERSNIEESRTFRRIGDLRKGG
jgi:hypothetical protein